MGKSVQPWVRRRRPSWGRSLVRARFATSLALLGITSAAYVATGDLNQLPRVHSSGTSPSNISARKLGCDIKGEHQRAGGAYLSLARARVLLGHTHKPSARGALVLLSVGSMVGRLAEGEGMMSMGKRLGSLITIVFALSVLSARVEASQCFDISKGQPEHLVGQLTYRIFPGSPNFEDVTRETSSSQRPDGAFERVSRVR
jgi:hypothetical protein